MTFNPDLNALVCHLSEAIRAQKSARAAFSNAQQAAHRLGEVALTSDDEVREAQIALDTYLRAQ